MANRDIVSECEVLPDIANDLRIEANQLVAGWQRVDRLRLMDIIQSMYHCTWSLKDLSRNIEEITRIKWTEPIESQLSLHRYDDHNELQADVLIERTKDWFNRMVQFQVLLTSILAEVRAMGAVARVTGIMTFRLKHDLDFLRKQYLKAFGQEP